MNMKKIWSVFLVAAILAGCQQDNRTTDEKFIDALKKGLSDRWEPADLDKDAEETTETFESYVNAELNQIKQYKDADFEDPDLQTAADAYIASLEHTLEITPTLDKDSNKFYELYSPVYSERGEALLQINEISPLEMANQEDQKELEELLDDAEITKAATDLASQIDFKVVKEDSDEDMGWYSADLEAKVKNDTRYTFDYFNVTANIIDADGTVITQGYTSVNAWKPDQTQTFKLYSDKKFNNVELAKVDYMIADNGFIGEVYFK